MSTLNPKYTRLSRHYLEDDVKKDKKGVIIVLPLYLDSRLNIKMDFTKFCFKQILLF